MHELREAVIVHVPLHAGLTWLEPLHSNRNRSCVTSFGATLSDERTTMCWLPRTNLSSCRAIRQQQLQPCHLCRFVVYAALNGGTLIDSLVSCPSIDPRKHCSVQTADFTSPPFWLYFFVPPTVWVYLLTVTSVAWSTGMRPNGLSSASWTENPPLDKCW